MGSGAALWTTRACAVYGAPAGHATGRVATNVLTGVGFLGGGLILQEGGTVRGLIAAVGIADRAERDGLAVLTSGLSRGVLAAERGASMKRRRRAKGAEGAWQAARSATARSGDLAEPDVDPGWWELLPPTAAPPRSG